ncbi:MAG TPA: peptidylprolyl isomerase [Gallionellaceae bacterium]
MLKLAKLAAIAAAGLLMVSPAYSQDKAAAKVNGVAIPQSLVDVQVKEATSQGQPDSPELRNAIVDQMINVELLSQEAAKKGLDQQQDFKDRIEMIRKSSLARAYVQEYFKDHPISEDKLKQEYDTLKPKMGGSEYKVSHILVATEEEAKAIEAQLKKGAKFDKIAKDKSKDPSSAIRGGDMGWINPSNYVPPFADSVTHLKKGQTSAPVQSQFGWHIIRLVDVRARAIPSFDQVRDELRQNMQQQAIQQMIGDLRKNAKIENTK